MLFLNEKKFERLLSKEPDISDMVDKDTSKEFGLFYDLMRKKSVPELELSEVNGLIKNFAKYANDLVGRKHPQSKLLHTLEHLKGVKRRLL